MDDEFPVLKVTRLDSFLISIDIGVNTFGNFGWLALEDVLDILGGGGGIEVDSLFGPGFGQAMGSNTYSFYTPGNPEAILEFVENEFTPPMGGDPVLTVNGRISLDVRSSVGDFETGPVLSLDPNPATDRITLTTDVSSPFRSLRVMDINGKLIVDRKEFDPREGLDVSSYEAGTYLMIVATDEGYTSKKFVVASRQ